LLVGRTCKGFSNKGERCRATPLRDADFCIFHDPEYAEAVKEGRRLGGLRRRREGTLAAAYDFDGLAAVRDLRRLLEIVTIDTLNLDNSVARNRVLIAAVLAGAKLLEVGEFESRLESLEGRTAIQSPSSDGGPRWPRPPGD
jgi:hypothetical protein